MLIVFPFTKMIFQMVQKNFDILGIGRTQTIYVFCAKVLFGHLLLGANIIFHFKFIFRDELAFQEYAKSLYVATIAVTSLICYDVMILIKDNFLNFINDLESIIPQFNESESKIWFLL